MWQIQDNLTRQIAEAVQQVTNAAGVAVVIEAKHMCMMMRGVEKQNSVMSPRCQDSCRLIGFIKTKDRGRKERCNAALFTRT